MGRTLEPARPNRYRASNEHNRIAPACGCEIGRDQSPLGHTRPRQVGRKAGLTVYQREQQAVRRAARALRRTL
jgi:hypothetical protein